MQNITCIKLPTPRACTSLWALAALFTLAAASSSLGAQESAPSTRRTVMLGGMVLPQSELALLKVSLDRGHWSIIADLTRDGTREEWAVDGSKGDYLLLGGSGSVRRYSRIGGRGYFVELGLGVASLTLDVTESDGSRATRRSNLPLGGWALGRRFSLGGSAGFVELAYRSSIPLETRHLYVDAVPPEEKPSQPISQRAWYLASGKGLGQLYAGLGLSF